MKVLALNGSARGEKGVTAKLLTALAQGLEEGGVQVEVVEVRRLKVNPCLACLKCMLDTPGVCTQDDDMHRLYQALKAADLLMMATPVYTDNMSAQLKMVIDRCICWSMPRQMLLLATCGFPEPETFAPLVATFRQQAANFHSRPLAELCLPGSIGLQMEPQRLGPHLGLLTQAGQSLAQEGQIPLPLLMAINRAPFCVDEYLEIGRRKLGG